MRWCQPLLWVLLGVACGGSDDDPTPTGDDDDGVEASTEDTALAPIDTGFDLCFDAPVVTWENFGAGFVTQHCQACHASGTLERNGAPSEVVFDEEADALGWSARILDRVLDEGDMPPQGGVTDDELALLDVWLSCYAD